MPGPAATSSLDGNRTFQQHEKGKFVHQAQPSPQQTRPAAANKWTKGTAPSTQYKASPFNPPTLADQNPALMNYMKLHRHSPAPILPALAKARRPNTCWVKGCLGGP